MGYLPLYMPGNGVTFTAEGAITGGTLVEVGAADWSVKTAAAASTKIVGVAAFDVADGEKVTVFIGKHVHELTAAGTIAVGGAVDAAADGKVAAATGAGQFLALTAGAADGPVAVLAL